MSRLIRLIVNRFEYERARAIFIDLYMMENVLDINYIKIESVGC